MPIDPLVMTVILEPVDGTRSIYTGDANDRPILHGQMSNVPDLLCGQCRMTLVKGRSINEIYRIVFKCPNCRAFNDAIF